MDNLAGLKQETVTNQLMRKRISKNREFLIRIKRNHSAMIGLAIFMVIVMLAVFAGVLVDYEKDCITPNIQERLQKPDKNHWLGTDALGRDQFARLIYGARISLFVSFSSVILSLFLGSVFGAIAGYYGGKTDEIIMRLTDIFTSIPNMLFSICIAAAFGQSMRNMIFAIGIVAVAGTTRIVRATVLTIRKQEYVVAGRAAGGNDAQIIFFHLIPNCIAPLIVHGTMRLANGILSISGLSFLGVGISPPTPEWGNMLSDGRAFIRDAEHLITFPGLAIALTILAINLLGDGLRDALDPKLRR